MTDLDRFMAKIEQADDGCWHWTGSRGEGYGVFYRDLGKGLRRVFAHRWSYEHFVGPIPEGLTIDHECHRAPCSGGVLCLHRRCVNPEHLAPVTRAVNAERQSRSWKTHCTQGHEFTPANTRIIKGGRRQCITCQNDRSLKNWRGKQPDARKRLYWI